MSPVDAYALTKVFLLFFIGKLYSYSTLPKEVFLTAHFLWALLKPLPWRKLTLANTTHVAGREEREVKNKLKN